MCLKKSSTCFLNEFSMFQKIAMRTCLYGFFALGILGVFLESRVFGVVYLIFMALMGSVVLHCFCSHCPYPYKFKTCLGMPYQAVTLFRFKDCKLSTLEKTLFISVLTVALLFPQYFLFQRMPLFAAYWIFCLPTCIVFPAYFCKRCRFVNCPFNAGKSQGD